MQYENPNNHTPMQIMETRIHMGEIDYMTGVLHAIGRVDLADRLIDYSAMEREFHEANEKWKQESGETEDQGFEEILRNSPPRPEWINQKLDELRAYKKETMKQIRQALSIQGAEP